MRALFGLKIKLHNYNFYLYICMVVSVSHNRNITVLALIEAQGSETPCKSLRAFLILTV